VLASGDAMRDNKTNGPFRELPGRGRSRPPLQAFEHELYGTVSPKWVVGTCRDSHEATTGQKSRQNSRQTKQMSQKHGTYLLFKRREVLLVCLFGSSWTQSVYWQFFSWRSLAAWREFCFVWSIPSHFFSPPLRHFFFPHPVF
jgi:hypothetical protein